MKKAWQVATSTGNYEKVISLIEHGVDINSLDRYGQTALMNATYQGDAKLVQLLVEYGADLEITAKYNLTALMLAVINDQNEIVRILVNAGANTAVKGSKGTSFQSTPVEYAKEHGKQEIVSILSDYI